MSILAYYVAARITDVTLKLNLNFFLKIINIE